MTSADLYRLHRPFVRRCLRRLGVTPDRLDDAEQDVFVVLVRRLGELELERGVRGWLWGVSRRVAWAHRNRARRRAPPIEVSTRPGQETCVALARALERLDDARLEILVLAEVEGRSAREIATRLGLPMTTVQWRLRSARKILRHKPRSRPRLSGWIPWLGRHATGSSLLAPGLATWAVVAAPVMPQARMPTPQDRPPSSARELRVVPWQTRTSTPSPPNQETVMPITILTFSAMLVAAPAPDCPRGQRCKVTDQDADEAARVRTKGPDAVYIFQGDEVDGEVWKPTGENIMGPVKLQHGSLLKIRSHFNRELIRLSFEL